MSAFLLPLVLCSLPGALIAPTAGQIAPPKALVVRPGEHPKEAERRVFHSDTPQPSLAAERAAAYAERLRREEDSLYGGLPWRNIGPEVQSGRVVTIASPRRQPGTVYVAFATGGLYRTTDDGQSWTSLWDRMPSFAIGDIAVSDDGRTIWVGTGESNSQRTSYAGTGVYRSEDAGKTWAFRGLPESHHIGRIVLDPQRPGTVWVAALGHLYSPNPDRGLYKTVNGGVTWNCVLAGDATTGAVDIQLDPKNPDRAIAAMWDRDRRAWNFREAGKGSAVMLTENGGRTWTRSVGLPSGADLGRVGLAVTPADPKRVYAYVDNQGASTEWLNEDENAAGGRLTPRRFARLTEAVFLQVPEAALAEFWESNAPKDFKLADAVAGVKAGTLTLDRIRDRIKERKPELFDAGTTLDEAYRSDDGGRTFRRLARFGPGGGYYYERAFANPADADDVFLCGVELKRSRDGGKTWRTVGREMHVDFHAVLFESPGKIWIGNDGGPYLATGGGEKWRPLNNLSVAQSTTLALDPRNELVYTGLQDNGTMRGSRRYVPGKSDLADWKAISGGDGSHIAVDAREESDLVYVAAQFGAHSAIDQKTNVRRSTVPKAAKDGPALRFNWISPLVLSKFRPDIVYMGSQFLHRSFDAGRTWETISPDLTRAKPNGNVPYSTIKDISESPLRFGLLYVAADDGRITMTPDGGYQWVDIPTPAGTKWASRIVASRNKVGTVYLSQSGYREDDCSAYLWQSDDFGKTWRSIVGDLPAETINVIREDPREAGTLYVGTDMGVWVSRDGGRHWQALGINLGHLPVHDLAIHERDDVLAVATHARGIFVTPLTPLRKLDGTNRKDPLYVFEPEPVTIPGSVRRARRETYMQDDPAAPVPNVPVEFFVRQAGLATIEVLDKEGHVLLTRVVPARRGYNRVEYSLLLRPAMPRPAQIPRPTTGVEAIADPLAGYRPEYLPEGTFKLRVSQGSASGERDLTIKG